MSRAAVVTTSVVAAFALFVAVLSLPSRVAPPVETPQPPEIVKPLTAAEEAEAEKKSAALAASMARYKAEFDNDDERARQGLPPLPDSDTAGSRGWHTPNPSGDGDGKHYDLACASAAMMKCYRDPQFAANAGVLMGNAPACENLSKRMCEVDSSGRYLNN